MLTCGVPRNLTQRRAAIPVPPTPPSPAPAPPAFARTALQAVPSPSKASHQSIPVYAAPLTLLLLPEEAPRPPDALRVPRVVHQPHALQRHTTNGLRGEVQYQSRAGTVC